MPDRAPLLMLLDAAGAQGGLQTDDVLRVALPLLREVAALHEEGLVAALDNVSAYRIAGDETLALADPQGRRPALARSEIDRLQAPASSVLRVVGQTRLTHEADAGVELQDLDVAEGDAAQALERPAYLPGYQAWERRFGHHDAAADILCLGQVLASLACGLDFSTAEDLRLFAAQRRNLFRLQPRLHPVVASVIGEMTELDRHRRTQDLPSVIRRLETYREQPQDLALDRLGAAQDGTAQRRRVVQTHLRDRLFDLSRRNRLLHFRATQSSVNLTVASVPLVVDFKSIRIDDLCLWDGRFAQEMLSGERVTLARWLRFEDQPYLPGVLDRIIQESRRDRAEYGFSQLSLVLAFLHWHNLKEDRDERIVSPLLLLPVELSRKKGVRDQYLLQADSSEARVNPVLRQQLRQVYGIALPETVDLRQQPAAEFHARLQSQIAATEPGVQLQLVTRPEIELIHQRARQRLEQFRRRQRVSVPVMVPAAAIDHSYSSEDFRPLGLALFHERVRPSPLPLREAVGAAPVPRQPQMADAQAQATTFSLRQRTGNPYQWEVDLSNLTLGNFNYRKMSLVRDYSALIDTDLPNPAFDRVFSLEPRALEGEAPPALPLEQQWPVVAADATQTAAVALARSGTSCIIQGPPGTGKSQTITNLIADHVGRGLRVLFVCEKRAAIDVVFHRLRQQGLDELCCMIHDSQADKKAFVLNLKQTYEHWLAADDGFEALDRQRRQMLNEIEQDLQALQRFDAAMRAVPEHLALPVRELVHRLVALHGHARELTSLQREALPTFAAWQRHGDLAARLQRTLAEISGTPALALHVFARLGEALVRSERPLARLAELTDGAETLIDRCADALAELPSEWVGLRWRELYSMVQQAVQLEPVAARRQLALLDAASDISRELDAACSEAEALARKLEAARAKTLHWKDKPGPVDAEAALAQARSLEGSVLRWLQPSWWRLSKTLAQRYDFARHAVKPSLRTLLSDLVSEHQAEAACDEALERLRERFGADSHAAFQSKVQGWRESARHEAALAGLHAHALRPGSESVVAKLAALADAAEPLAATLNELVHHTEDLTLDGLGEWVRDLREQADSLPELLPLLRELVDADPALSSSLRALPLSALELEHAVAQENLERVYRGERWLPRFDGAVLARHVQRLARGERRLQALNAQVLRAGVRRRFGENVRRSNLAASQLDAEGKLFKKSYAAGRRELEHEFGKTMRYKAIRELASGDSGRVVRDMKPIWLMSPLSVSDTLPLDTGLFDVVIFDEASQIPVEEAVPALYRAPQVIIVGDEMQLPPTSFFASSRDDEEGALTVEEDGERMAVVLDADSLLNQGARNLPATLLAWHYRSRYESLIGFSNAAFYAGNLYTVPDRSVARPGRAPIVVQGSQPTAPAVAAAAQALLERPISFHAVEDAVYAQRRNEAEARYIAWLVRELLLRETGMSLGIVAFSEAQQSEIESALAVLAASDADFAARLEAETVREQDDQFCGLFVKNLENVQGDERDVILLSICYGRGPDGRMLMNFGPINQRGGEKRLNVIFSRARRHMAVVSSIHHDAITNDYNEGASALKQFLRYAECVSQGDQAQAQRVLEGLNPLTRKALSPETGADEVVAQLARALRERGHAVDERVGQSRFRCDLGIRDPQGDHYALAILVDTAAHYANPDVLERYVSRPRILRGFGWRTLQVLSRDWFHDRQLVLDAIERALASNGTEAEAEMQAEAEPLPAPASAEATVPATKPPAPDPEARAPMASTAVIRRFECTEGGSRKFWQICRQGTELTIGFGRLGTQGQTQQKQFANEARARQEHDKLIAEKLRKGYVEITG